MTLSNADTPCSNQHSCQVLKLGVLSEGCGGTGIMHNLICCCAGDGRAFMSTKEHPSTWSQNLLLPRDLQMSHTDCHCSQ